MENQEMFGMLNRPPTEGSVERLKGAFWNNPTVVGYLEKKKWAMVNIAIEAEDRLTPLQEEAWHQFKHGK